MTELRIECCDPRDRADQIKALFARTGPPGFDEVFERAYRPRAEFGLRSWVGLIGDDVVMHVSVSPDRFHDGTRSLVGGILGDLMVDQAHRDFWLPLRLLRSMVGDLRREGHVDFLFTTTVPVSESLFKAGGFTPFDQLRRFVFPLVAPYLMVSRIRSGGSARDATTLSPGDDELTSHMPCFRSGAHWRPLATPLFYDTRIPRDEYADANWVRLGAEATSPDWALLSRHSVHREVALADAFWAGGASLADVVLTAARWGRGNGLRKLSITTLDGSSVARQLTAAGFLPRSYRATVLLQQLSGNAPPPVQDWFLTGLACSAW